MRLFADHGADAVTIRAVAAAAEVSPALVMRHYGTKTGLRDAVDDYMADVFESMLGRIVHGDDRGPFTPEAAPTLAAQVIAQLPAGSPVPAYLGRMLLTGGPAGSTLFARLYAIGRSALSGLVDAGFADAGADPAVRAAFLLVNDLGLLILRPHVSAVLGIDPLTEEGMRRWGAEVLSIYRSGLGDETAEDDR